MDTFSNLPRMPMIIDLIYNLQFTISCTNEDDMLRLLISIIGPIRDQAQTFAPILKRRVAALVVGKLIRDYVFSFGKIS